MQEYKILIEETVSQAFAIQANSEEEAVQIAREKYKTAELVLEPGDLIDIKIHLLEKKLPEINLGARNVEVIHSRKADGSRFSE